MATILLVEDNQFDRDLLSRRLTACGHQILTAVDGLQGLEVAQAEQPDLIILDMGLPSLDGWQAARALKGLPQTRHIPILALTIHSLASDRERALAAGCDEYEIKPTHFPRLIGKIEALLGQQTPQ